MSQKRVQRVLLAIKADKTFEKRVP